MTVGELTAILGEFEDDLRVADVNEVSLIATIEREYDDENGEVLESSETNWVVVIGSDY